MEIAFDFFLCEYLTSLLTSRSVRYKHTEFKGPLNMPKHRQTHIFVYKQLNTVESFFRWCKGKNLVFSQTERKV